MFESAGDIMKKRSWSALSHSDPPSPEPGIPGERPVCVANALLLCVSQYSLQGSCLHRLPACCGLCLLSVVWVGPEWPSCGRTCPPRSLGEEWSGGISSCRALGTGATQGVRLDVVQKLVVERSRVSACGGSCAPGCWAGYQH